jgi:hypothetical protein
VPPQSSKSKCEFAIQALSPGRGIVCYRILHAAARLTRGSRRRRLKIPATWPWTLAIATAWTRITARPRHPDQQQAIPRSREDRYRDPWNPHPASQLGRRHTQTLKSRSTARLRHRHQPTSSQAE